MKQNYIMWSAAYTPNQGETSQLVGRSRYSRKNPIRAVEACKKININLPEEAIHKPHQFDCHHLETYVQPFRVEDTARHEIRKDLLPK